MKFLKKKSNEELSMFAKGINQSENYNQYKNSNNFSDDQMMLIIKKTVLELMRRDLLIPTNGNTVDMMAMAEVLSEGKEFGNKYKG